MSAIPRREVLRRLHRQIETGHPIIGAGAGSGLSARAEQAGGADLIIIYNSRRFRTAGYSSLAGLFAFGNANETVLELAREILPVSNIPVIAGVNSADPFTQMPPFLTQLQTLGFSGVQNFPTAGIFEGALRVAMEQTGFGYDKEIEMIALAHQMDLFTSPYVFAPDEAAAMTRAGADMIVPHVGLTVTGTVGAQFALSLDQAINKTLSMADAARRVRDDVLVVCHGGPFDQPENVGKAFAQMPGVVGLYGASNIERLPAEHAIMHQVSAFKALRLNESDHDM
jgi:predicted TIM-barrel enzyme